MPIIEDIDRRSDYVPKLFVDGYEELKPLIFINLISIVNQLETLDGKFISSAKNLRLASTLEDAIRGSVLTPEYEELLTDFIREFNTQAKLNDTYLKTLSKNYTRSELSQTILNISKRNTIDDLLNVVNPNFVTPVKEFLEQSVTSGSTYTETLGKLENFIEKGPLKRHLTLTSSDSFTITSNSYIKSGGEELGLEWYYYTPGQVADSRPFCIQRQNRYFHRKEIELWGSGTGTPGYTAGDWKGKLPGTDSQTIFSYRGGYNCMHTILPLSVFGVPKKDIRRAVDLGYYTPTTKVEKENLK